MPSWCGQYRPNPASRLPSRRERSRTKLARKTGGLARDFRRKAVDRLLALDYGGSGA
jgi:hypothetical protein